MKNHQVAFLTALFLTVFPLQISFAQEAQDVQGASLLDGFSLTLGAMSDYRDRGISLSDEHPAVKGSVDWEHDSGFYLGVFGATVDFNDGGEADYELDLYAGYVMEWAGFEWDVMANGIFYPGADDALDYDQMEYSVIAARDIGSVSAKAGVIFSPDNFGDSGPAFYPSLEASVPVMETGFSATASYGFQSVDDKLRNGLGDYSDWSAGVAYTWQDTEFTLKYVDTNLDKTECAEGCDAAVVFAVSKTFGG